MSHTPLFIVVEGIDGLGKSTLSQSMAEILNGIYVRTPSALRTLLSNVSVPSSESYPLFLADRILTYHGTIKPALEEGQHVVCDRYNLSNWAYQATLVGRERVLADASHPPHILFFLEGSLELASARRTARTDVAASNLDQFEVPEKLRSAKKMYDEALRNHISVFCDDIEILDASQTPLQLLTQAVEVVKTLLLNENPANMSEVLEITRRMNAYVESQEKTS